MDPDAVRRPAARSTRRPLGRALAVGLLTALLAGLLVGVAGPAQAQTRTLTDPVGDAPATRDLTSLKVGNGGRVLTVVARVSDLQRGGGLTLGVFLETRPRDNDGFGVVSRAPTKRRPATLLVYRGRYASEDIVSLSCRGARIRWQFGADTIRLRLPQRCFGALAGDVAPAAYLSDNRPDPGQDSLPDDYPQAAGFISRG